MRVLRLFTALFAALVVGAAGAEAAAVDDANAAVLAAKDGHYDDAIRLFTDALETNEMADRGRAQAFSYRGISLAAIGNYPAALRDLDSAVALNSPYQADAYSYRGFLELSLGRSADGAADLAKGADLLVWPYNVLWLAIARAKAGVPDTGVHSLKNNAAMLDLSRWPGPVLQYYLGGLTSDEVRAAAEMGDPMAKESRVCDAVFYIGEFDLAHGNAEMAEPSLNRAANDCPYSSFERVGAAAELSHWGK